jgi:hypothetical protein
MQYPEAQVKRKQCLNPHVSKLCHTLGHSPNLSLTRVRSVVYSPNPRLTMGLAQIEPDRQNNPATTLSRSNTRPFQGIKLLIHPAQTTSPPSQSPPPTHEVFQTAVDCVMLSQTTTTSLAS